jgi:thiol-disulfide isomerase/thioredoxin
MRSLLAALALSAALLIPAGMTVPALAQDESRPAFTMPAPHQARVINQADIETLLKSHDHDLLVVNFWATWCGQCVEELPAFIAAEAKYRDKDVLFVGFSLDFVDAWEEIVPPFLKEKGIVYPNFVLDVDPNVTVPYFSKDWAGNIPATFFFDRSGKNLGGVTEPVHGEELDKMVAEYLKKATAPVTEAE